MEQQHRREYSPKKNNTSQQNQTSGNALEQRLTAYQRISDQIQSSSGIGAQHGVTTRQVNAAVVGQTSPKTVTVKASTEVPILKTETNDYIAEVEIRKVVNNKLQKNRYQVRLPKSAVKVTPNNLSEINEPTRKKIVVDTNKVVLTNADYSGDMSAGGFLHTPGIPKGLRVVFEGLTGNLLADPAVFNNTFSMKVNFGNIPTEVSLSESERQKYNGNTFVFRFTTLPHASYENTILVEELGEFKETSMLARDRQNIDALMTQHNITIHAATAAEISNARQLTTNVEASKNKTYAIGSATERLYHQAFLAFTPQEEDTIRRALTKMTPKMMSRLTGVVFHKRAFVYLSVSGQKVKFDKGWVGAQYHRSSHTVSVYDGATNPNQKLVFGDKGAAAFTGKQEETIIHELGHTVDLSELAKAGIKHKELKEKLKNASPNDKAKVQQELNNYTQKYKGIKSLTGRAYSGKETTTLNYKADFDKAVAKDLPKISKYAKTNDMENFADAFALYITEPKTLEKLSPNVYTYFKTTFPR